MKFKIATYTLVTIPFLVIGYFTSFTILNNDKELNQNLYIGSSKILYNTYYKVYSIDELVFNVRQTVNVYEDYYNPEFHEIKIKKKTQELLEEEFKDIRKKLSILNKELVSIELRKLDYTNLLVKSYNRDLEEIRTLIKANENSIRDNIEIYLTLIEKIYELEKLENDMKIHIFNDEQTEIKENFKFVELGEIRYTKQALNFRNNSRIVIVLTFFIIGLFISWSIIEIKNYLTKRNQSP